MVARVDEIGQGERKLVRAGGREIAIFHLGDDFYALLNRCPHQGGPLCYGELVKSITSARPSEYLVDQHTHLIACPWHGWEFDLSTGRSYFDPARLRARQFSVEIEDGRTLSAQMDLTCGAAPLEPVEGPYRAPLLPVTIEEQYVVVTVPTRRADAS